MQAVPFRPSIPTFSRPKYMTDRGRRLALAWMPRITGNHKVEQKMIPRTHGTRRHHIHSIQAEALGPKMPSIHPPRALYQDLIQAQASLQWMKASGTVLVACPTTSCTSLAFLPALRAPNGAQQRTQVMLPANLLQRTLMGPSHLRIRPERLL